MLGPIWSSVWVRLIKKKKDKKDNGIAISQFFWCYGIGQLVIQKKNLVSCNFYNVTFYLILLPESNSLLIFKYICKPEFH